MDVKIMMLGFAHHSMCREAMADVKQYVFPKTLFDVGYPHPGQEEKLKEACHEFHWNYQKMENQGTAGNWNEAFRFLGRPDILVGIEPDERVNNKSWVARACDCLRDDPKLGYVGLGQGHFRTMYDVDPNFKNEVFTVGNNTLKNYKTGIGWACGAVSKAFMEKVGIKSDPYYGNAEPQTAEAMKKAGFRWGLFTDIFAIHICGEPSYETWKVLSGDRKTTLSFPDWLTSNASSRP